MDFLSLPVVMIENVFSFLTYDEIAKNRVVCKPFNEICCRMLNRGFLMIERRHSLALKTVKAQLPRRESERRYHPLSRHCDILSSIETRISMLNMTYAKFIDSGICCFIPGKVIDEIKRVLTLVESSTMPPRAHEVLQELRDISSMAIEHFDDKISPVFKQMLRTHNPTPNHPTQSQHVKVRARACIRELEKRLRRAASFPFSVSYLTQRISLFIQYSKHPCFSEEGQSATVIGPVVLKQEMQHLKRRSILNARLSLYLASQYKKFYTRMVAYRQAAGRQRRIIKDLTQKHIEQDAAIADLKKRIEECDIKYSELTHTNQAVGASSSTVVTQSTPAQPLRHFASQIKLDLSHLPIGTGKRTHGKLQNIKPRKPVLRLPSISEIQGPSNLEPRVCLVPLPSTSADQPPRPKPQTTWEKVENLTKEIRNIAKCDRHLRSNKRSKSFSCDATERKKIKLD